MEKHALGVVWKAKTKHSENTYRQKNLKKQECSENEN